MFPQVKGFFVTLRQLIKKPITIQRNVLNGLSGKCRMMFDFNQR